MTDILQAITTILYELWPVLVGGLVVAVSLVALARLGQAALFVSFGSGRGTAEAVMGLLSALMVGMFAFLAADDLARGAMLGLGCDVGFAQDLLQGALQLLYAIISIRILWAGFRGIVSAAVGGPALSTTVVEAVSVLLSSLAIPFLAAFAARFFSC